MTLTPPIRTSLTQFEFSGPAAGADQMVLEENSRQAGTSAASRVELPHETPVVVSGSVADAWSAESVPTGDPHDTTGSRLQAFTRPAVSESPSAPTETTPGAPTTAALPSPSSPSSPSSHSTPAHHTEADHLAAQAETAVCEQFRTLLAQGHSGRQAAALVARPAAWWSGTNAPYQRWLREGHAALLPTPRRASAPVGVTAEIEALGWAIPAARFFNLNINRTADTGSVPEAIRRLIYLPDLPVGWSRAYTRQFLKVIGCPEVPVFPEALRDAILARQAADQPLVPDRIARQIGISPVTVGFHRRPHESDLKYLSCPGTSMWRRDNLRPSFIKRAGDELTADDGTINFPVCIPWTDSRGTPITAGPCQDKYGVIVGRFQWLPAMDVATRFCPGWVFIARPRSSYRGADVLTLLRGLIVQHGIWEQYAFERGVWKSNLVTQAIKLLQADLKTVHSPHAGGKVFAETGFNYAWTKLSVHFPQCDLGRFQGDTEATNRSVQACRSGAQDPRRLFPLLSDAMRAFDLINRERNATPVTTANHGCWVPEERWHQQVVERPMRRLAPELEFAFQPYAMTWTVRGMLVGGRVPLFEDMSVPFDFSAHWLAQYQGAKVRVHFDPAAPKCIGTGVLAEAFAGRPIGTILGTLTQVNETTGYIRTLMGWGDDDPRAGLVAKQQAAKAVRTELRTILPKGGHGTSESKAHDGLATTTTIATDGHPQPLSPICPISENDFAARLSAADDWEKEHALDLL